MRETVHNRSCIQPEDQHRTVAEGAENGQRERRVVGKLKHEPGGGHRLHPGPDHGYRLAHEIAAEFWVLEGGNLHHGATAWFDGRRSGADSFQVIGGTPANRWMTIALVFRSD